MPWIIALVGAAKVRPILDDYAIEAVLTRSGSAPSAVWSWLNNWTPLYTYYSALTGGVAAGRALGVDRYGFAIGSALLIALLFVSMMLVWRGWARLVAGRVPAVTAALLLGAGLLGSMSSFVWTDSAILFGSIYWSSAWMQHFVPILLAPLVIWWIVCGRPTPRFVAPALALLIGFVVGGFGTAEDIMFLSVLAATGWAMRRLGGRELVRARAPRLLGVGLGVFAGLITVWSLPGSHARAGSTLAPDAVSSALAGPFWRSLAGVIESTALSPAPVLGLVIGIVLYWLSRRAAPDGGPAVGQPGRTESAGTVVWCLLVVLMTGVVATAYGDVILYPMWWHYISLWAVVFLLGVGLGWMAARALKARILAAFSASGLAVCIVWASASCLVAAGATWTRQPVYDANVALARAVASGSQPPPVIWQSMGVGLDIWDASWPGLVPVVRSWLDLEPDELRFVDVPSPQPGVPLPRVCLVWVNCSE